MVIDWVTGHDHKQMVNITIQTDLIPVYIIVNSSSDAFC
jgi:hypothetical protein